MIHQEFGDVFNMPPHHMGHYNEETFSKISPLLNADIVSVGYQPDYIRPQRLTTNNSNRLIWKIYRKIASFSGNTLLKLLKEPGHTMYVVLRKK